MDNDQTAKSTRNTRSSTAKPIQHVASPNAFFLNRAQIKERKQKEQQSIFKKEIQLSQQMTTEISKGKTLNPFFNPRKADTCASVAVHQEPIEALCPRYDTCHVGYRFQKSIGKILNCPFPMRTISPLNLDIPIVPMSRLLVQSPHDVPSDKIQPAATRIMLKSDIDAFLQTEYSQSALNAPPCQQLYTRIMCSSHVAPSLTDLWIDKYAPMEAANILGPCQRNMAASLSQWLRLWKPPKAADRARLKKAKKRNNGDASDTDDFITSDSSLSDSEYSESAFSYPISKFPHRLLLGPPGVGKTALIAAIAKDTGYSLLEIHSGMKRSGKDLISTLGETTSSRLVGGAKTKQGWRGVMQSLNVRDECLLQAAIADELVEDDEDPDFDDLVILESKIIPRDTCDDDFDSDFSTPPKKRTKSKKVTVTHGPIKGPLTNFFKSSGAAHQSLPPSQSSEDARSVRFDTIS